MFTPRHGSWKYDKQDDCFYSDNKNDGKVSPSLIDDEFWNEKSDLAFLSSTKREKLSRCIKTNKKQSSSTKKTRSLSFSLGSHETNADHKKEQIDKLDLVIFIYSNRRRWQSSLSLSIAGNKNMCDKTLLS